MSAFLTGSQSLLVTIFPAIGRKRIVAGSDSLLVTAPTSLAANTPAGPFTVVSIYQAILILAGLNLNIGAYFSAVFATMERRRVGAGAGPCCGSLATGR